MRTARIIRVRTTTTLQHQMALPVVPGPRAVLNEAISPVTTLEELEPGWSYYSGDYIGVNT